MIGKFTSDLGLHNDSLANFHTVLTLMWGISGRRYDVEKTIRCHPQNKREGQKPCDLRRIAISARQLLAPGPTSLAPLMARAHLRRTAYCCLLRHLFPLFLRIYGGRKFWRSAERVAGILLPPLACILERVEREDVGSTAMDTAIRPKVFRLMGRLTSLASLSIVSASSKRLRELLYNDGNVTNRKIQR